MIKLTPVQERIVTFVAQYEREHGEYPSSVVVEKNEKKEAEKLLAVSAIQVKVKNGTTNNSANH